VVPEYLQKAEQKNMRAKTPIAIYITGKTSSILAFVVSPIKTPTNAGVKVAITELKEPPIWMS